MTELQRLINEELARFRRVNGRYESLTEYDNIVFQVSHGLRCHHTQAKEKQRKAYEKAKNGG